jgi:hypothetical protein
MGEPFSAIEGGNGSWQFFLAWRLFLIGTFS